MPVMMIANEFIKGPPKVLFFSFVCLIVYSHLSDFSAIWRLSLFPVIGLQI
jgi:hypothetical protein